MPVNICNRYKQCGLKFDMESLRNEASEAAKYVGKKIEESVSQWAGMLIEVVDKLTEKNMEVTHNFQNF